MTLAENSPSAVESPRPLRVGSERGVITHQHSCLFGHNMNHAWVDTTVGRTDNVLTVDFYSPLHVHKLPSE
jgi:hypothetical protein